MTTTNVSLSALAISMFFLGECCIAFSQQSEVLNQTLVDDLGYQVIHEKTSAIHGQIAIYAKQETESDQWHMRVQYIKTNAKPSDIHLSEPMILNVSNTSELAFNSLIDEATGVWCLYDTGNHGCLILVAPPNEQRHRKYDIWHPGVREIGWGRGIWIRYFKAIKEAHNDIPYDSLPAELETPSPG